MKNLPDVFPGHWDTPEGLRMATRYAALHRYELPAQNMTDLGVANAVFMDPSIMNLTIAKDRIRWLSVQLAIALDLVQTAHGVMAEPSDIPGSQEWFDIAERLLKIKGQG